MYTITRKIEIDAGHRVTHHRSKCRNFHGHRYVIYACCESIDLVKEGEEQGMVMDFGFLKDEMMDTIDYIYDHAMILWVNDPIVAHIIEQEDRTEAYDVIRRKGLYISTEAIIGKTILIPSVPTAENLAEIWFNQLVPKIKERTDDRAKLVYVQVKETPNCTAVYQPGKESFDGLIGGGR